MSSTNAVLKAESREKSTKGAVRSLRLDGKIPAIIYGKGKPQQLISVNEKEFLLAYRKGSFFAKTVTLDLGKEKIKVLPQDMQIEPARDKPLHADFIRVDDDSMVKVSIPVEFVGRERSPGLKRGGVLNTVRRTIDVTCKVSDIPDHFTADISKKKIKENVKFSDLNVPEGVTPFIEDRDFTIATIAGRVAEVEVDEEEVATTTEEGATEEAKKAE